MGLPQLETCCFVFDLRTGNIIIGSINAFISFLLTVLMIMAAVAISSLDDSTNGHADAEVEAVITGAYILSIILVLMYLTKLIFDIALVYAITTERAGIIKGYFFMWIVFFLLSMFMFFLNIAYYHTGTICVKVFYLGMNIYAILLHYSFYKQLNNREVV